MKGQFSCANFMRFFIINYRVGHRPQLVFSLSELRAEKKCSTLFLSYRFLQTENQNDDEVYLKAFSFFQTPVSAGKC